MTEMGLALMLMGYGLIGVFTVLIVFYIVIKLLMKVFPEK
jgi:tetrahydromethanopterin S-methyltransferase subunit E